MQIALDGKFTNVVDILQIKFEGKIINMYLLCHLDGEVSFYNSVEEVEKFFKIKLKPSSYVTITKTNITLGKKRKELTIIPVSAKSIANLVFDKIPYSQMNFDSQLTMAKEIQKYATIKTRFLAKWVKNLTDSK